MLYEHAAYFFVWFSGVFVVTGSIGWSFQTPNLEVCKTEQEKLFVLIYTIPLTDDLHIQE